MTRAVDYFHQLCFLSRQRVPDSANCQLTIKKQLQEVVKFIRYDDLWYDGGKGGNERMQSARAAEP
jgi:hypothetical protein